MVKLNCMAVESSLRHQLSQCVFNELDESDRFQFKYQYDSVGLSWNIYDLDSDGKQETHFLGYSGDQRFFSRVLYFLRNNY